MKSIFLIAALVGAVLPGCASQPGTVSHDHLASQPAASAVAENMDERLNTGLNEARVNGLSCPLCAESLSAVMGRVEGVESVKLDLDRGVVIISITKPAPTREQVASAIDDAGFTFVSFLERDGG